MTRFVGVGLTAVLALTLGYQPGIEIPELGEVNGTVTVDGKPLEGVAVTFVPESGALASVARTGSDGKYELLYAVPGAKQMIKGAALGQHTVRIDILPDPLAQTASQPLPARYNIESALTADVKSGPNTFDFQVTSR